jgi:NTP pyrophosphatase (non-canonical NTP hydrolase)
MLLLDDYQTAAFKTAIYPGKGSHSLGALTYCALGLGEVGEIQGKIKKIWREDYQLLDEVRVNEIALELGDALWYVAAMANELGFRLSDIATMNLEKLAARAAAATLKGDGDNR